MLILLLIITIVQLLYFDSNIVSAQQETTNSPSVTTTITNIPTTISADLNSSKVLIYRLCLIFILFIVLIFLKFQLVQLAGTIFGHHATSMKRGHFIRKLEIRVVNTDVIMNDLDI